MNLWRAQVQHLTVAVADAAAAEARLQRAGLPRSASDTLPVRIADYLSRHGKVSHREIESVFGIERSTASRAISKAISLKLIKCVSKPEARFNKEYEVR